MNNFTMPTPEIVQEYKRDLDKVDGCLTNTLIHTKCRTEKEFDESDILEELQWMREHHHECANELHVTIDQGVYVKVRMLPDGQTELYVWNARSKTQKETTKTARLYPSLYPGNELTRDFNITADLEETEKD